MVLLSLIAASLALPVLEVPADHARDARRVMRDLGELGYSSTVVRPNGGLRVRLDLQAADLTTAKTLADRLAIELGRGVLTFDDVATPLPPAVLTVQRPSLSLRLARGDDVTFQFRRVMSDGVMSHTWVRRGSDVAVILEAVEGDLTSSRLLHGPLGSWIWVDGTRSEALSARSAEWVAQLSPEVVLSSAFAAGFGGFVQPTEGCQIVGGQNMCVGSRPESMPNAIAFEDLLRTVDGEWLPASIRRYSAGKLVDHVIVLAIGFADPTNDLWFDADYP